MNEDLKGRLIAEVKFLRAYNYFELVKNFGDLPKVIKVISPQDGTMPRSPRSEIYEEIIEKED